MLFNLALIVTILANISCSSNSKYGVVALEPTLTVKVPQGPYTEGQPFTAEATIKQEGIYGNFFLSVVVIAGKASITLDGSDISTAGDWSAITGNNAKLIIIPNAAEDLLISIQAKSPGGKTSDKYLLRGHVNATSELTAKANYESKYVNPDVSTLIPIHLMIDKEGYDGRFKVEAAVTKGDGNIYDDQKHVVNGQSFMASADALITYHPKIIGEHIITFTISAEKATTTVRTYFNVVKNISVTCNVQEGFTIDGIGEHDTEGETVTLSLVNEPKFNFEVAGWYDSTDKLLSSDPTFAILLSRDCIADLKVKLKQRTVTIRKDGVYHQPQNYLVMENGKPVSKTVYNYRTQLLADYRVSDPIKFYYEEYRYDMSTIPPTPRKSNAAPTFNNGASQTSYLYRIDNNFKIYLRKADNPGLTITSSYIESSSTRYILPSGIIIQ